LNELCNDRLLIKQINIAPTLSLIYDLINTFADHGMMKEFLPPSRWITPKQLLNDLYYRF